MFILLVRNFSNICINLESVVRFIPYIVEEADFCSSHIFPRVVNTYFEFNNLRDFSRALETSYVNNDLYAREKYHMCYSKHGGGYLNLYYNKRDVISHIHIRQEFKRFNLAGVIFFSCRLTLLGMGAYNVFK